MKKFLGRLFGIIIILGIIGVIAYFAYQRMNKPPEEIQVKELPTVKLTKLKKGNIESVISLMGTVQPSDTYVITPKVSGELRQIYVKNGDYVKAGSPIAVIDNQKQIDSARISVEQAQLQVNSTSASLARMLPLFQSGDISAQEFDTAKNQVDAALVSAQSAQLNYDTQVENATVKAPAAGTIQNANMSINAMVSQTSQLCSLTGTGAKTVNFNVTEDVRNSISIGQEVTLEKSGVTYTANVTDIAQTVNSQTGLFLIKATLISGDRLADGASCKVNFISAYSENTDLISQDNLYYSGGNPYVYVYEGGKVKKVNVVLGIQNSEQAEVKEGLNASMQIVDSWTKDIYDGAEVKIEGESDNKPDSKNGKSESESGKTEGNNSKSESGSGNSSTVSNDKTGSAEPASEEKKENK